MDRHARSFRRVLLRLLVRALQRVRPSAGETVVVAADRQTFSKGGTAGRENAFRLAGTQNPQMFLLVPRVLKRTPRGKGKRHSANRTRERLR